MSTDTTIVHEGLPYCSIVDTFASFQEARLNQRSKGGQQVGEVAGPLASVQTQADLVDQLFNSADTRLARTLLSLARFGKEGRSEHLSPKISQETLAERVGTTRVRINFFMNRFRQLGLIDYTGGLEVMIRYSTSSYTSNVFIHEDLRGGGCTHLNTCWTHESLYVQRAHQCGGAGVRQCCHPLFHRRC